MSVLKPALIEAVAVAPFLMRLILPLILMCAPQFALAEETRCGWFSNPTPANYGLADALGFFELASQGGAGADGFYDALDVSTGSAEWVAKNGSYGFGCACVVGEYDLDARTAISVSRVTMLPLAQCENDSALPRNVFGDVERD